MIVIYHLILAHLLGDFAFQPNALIKWKFKSWKGVFVHAAIITTLSLLFVSPYLMNWQAWVLILLLGVSHFIQDSAKVGYQKWASKNTFYPFLADQAAHMFFIWLFGTQIYQLDRIGFSGGLEKYYSSEHVALFASLIVFFTFTMDIVVYEIRKLKKPKLHYHRDSVGIWHRLAAFILAYLLFLFLTLI